MDYKLYVESYRFNIKAGSPKHYLIDSEGRTSRINLEYIYGGIERYLGYHLFANYYSINNIDNSIQQVRTKLPNNIFIRKDGILKEIDKNHSDCYILLRSTPVNLTRFDVILEIDGEIVDTWYNSKEEADIHISFMSEEDVWYEDISTGQWLYLHTEEGEKVVMEYNVTSDIISVTRQQKLNQIMSRNSLSKISKLTPERRQTSPIRQKVLEVFEIIKHSPYNIIYKFDSINFSMVTKMPESERLIVNPDFLGKMDYLKSLFHDGISIQRSYVSSTVNIFQSIKNWARLSRSSTLMLVNETQATYIETARLLYHEEKELEIKKRMGKLTESLQAIYPDRWDIQQANDSDVYCTILFPEIVITNSTDHSHTIQDLYVRFTIQNMKYIKRLSGARGKLSQKEVNSGYAHSHLPGIPWTGFQTFCTGSAEIDTLMMEISVDEKSLVDNIDMFEYFLVQIEEFVKWESIEGTPHVYLNTIHNNKRYVTSSGNVTLSENHYRHIISHPEFDFTKLPLQYSINTHMDLCIDIRANNNYLLMLANTFTNHSDLDFHRVYRDNSGFYLTGDNNNEEPPRHRSIGTFRGNVVIIEIYNDTDDTTNEDSRIWPHPSITQSFDRYLRETLWRYYTSKQTQSEGNNSTGEGSPENSARSTKENSLLMSKN